MNQIKAWTLLKRKAEGRKVSSRVLSRVLKKAQLCTEERTMGARYCETHLKETYTLYNETKGNTAMLRSNFLHMLAEAWAEKQNRPKEKVYRNLLRVEQQRSTAKRIKYIRGKLKCGSTLMVQVKDTEGNWQDITEKEAIEAAIMEGTKTKYTTSFNTPFMQPPLSLDFGYLSQGTAAEAVLDGSYITPEGIDKYTKSFIEHLQRPQRMLGTADFPMLLPIELYRAYWKRAREYTSHYPGEMSFSTLMTRIPLFAGYSPKRRKKCLDVMILKKAGLMRVDSPRTIVLFQPDCNYAFKFLDREMMKNAERYGTIAPEQFGSRQKHIAFNLAVNKVVTNDILRQTKTPGAICSNDAKSCYDLIIHP
jgi:hypothetical protein